LATEEGSSGLSDPAGDMTGVPLGLGL
jgi:hypothetical protein